MRYPLLWLLGLCLLGVAGCAIPPEPEPAGLDYVSQVDDPQAKALYHYGRYRLLLAEGEEEAAVAALQEAIRLDPENEELRFELAEVYIALDQVKQAVRTVEDILIRNPDSIKAHLRLGNAYLRSREPSRALPHFRKILELEPDNEQVRLHLAIAYARANDAGQAIEELKGLLKLNPDSQQGRLALARLYRETKLDALAIEQYQAADRASPRVDSGFLGTGAALRGAPAMERRPEGVSRRPGQRPPRILPAAPSRQGLRRHEALCRCHRRTADHRRVESRGFRCPSQNRPDLSGTGEMGQSHRRISRNPGRATGSRAGSLLSRHGPGAQGRVVRRARSLCADRAPIHRFTTMRWHT